MGHDNTLSAPLMTVTQAAQQLQVARKTIYDWINKGFIKAARLPGGSEIRIRRVDFEAFVASMFGDNDDTPSPNTISAPVEPTEEDPPKPRQRLAPGGKRDFFALGAAA